MAEIHDETVDRLPLVSARTREAILAAPRTTEAHRAFMAELPAMSLVETGGGGTDADAPAPQILTVAAWNLQRCLFVEKSAALLAAQQPDVILLSEMDCGMARTAQRHTVADLAAELGMHYCYGVEFFELGLGSEIERPYCTDDHNAAGWHGNAVLSRAAPVATALIRLDDHGHWFIDADFPRDPAQLRIGGRMAIASIIPTVAGKLCVASVHLESNAGSEHRGSQMERLIEAIDRFAPELPVLIGGDLNTGNSKDAPDWRDEALFDIARDHGYSWDNNAEGVTTRRSFLMPHPTRAMKLDWFAARGLSMDGAEIVPALDPAGEPLSDHELIVGHFAIP
tara:strand:+ start:4786 stop:5802 length:1017 start_codon:yes stop_codon:yes gene_type:complete